MKLKIKKSYVILSVIFQVVYTISAYFLLRSDEPVLVKPDSVLCEFNFFGADISIARPDFWIFNSIIRADNSINIGVFVFRTLFLILVLTLIVGLYDYFKNKPKNDNK